MFFSNHIIQWEPYRFVQTYKGTFTVISRNNLCLSIKPQRSCPFTVVLFRCANPRQNVFSRPTTECVITFYFLNKRLGEISPKCLRSSRNIRRTLELNRDDTFFHNPISRRQCSTLARRRFRHRRVRIIDTSYYVHIAFVKKINKYIMLRSDDEIPGNERRHPTPLRSLTREYYSVRTKFKLDNFTSLIRIVVPIRPHRCPIVHSSISNHMIFYK